MFYSTTDLVQRTIVRLRMVAGGGTQLYAEDAIAQLLEETYEMVRSQRWWDYLMKWEDRQLDGTTGKVTVPFIGARERFRDVQMIYVGNSSMPLPILSNDLNPNRFSGTTPRVAEPLHRDDDNNSTTQYLFRVWPKASVTTVDRPIRVRIRLDPPSLFTNANVIIPFDATCLVNGAAFKYAADDGTNPASVASLQSAFESRLLQLQRQHDNAAIMLDPRMSDPIGQTDWIEARY